MSFHIHVKATFLKSGIKWHHHAQFGIRLLNSKAFVYTTVSYNVIFVVSTLLSVSAFSQRRSCQERSLDIMQTANRQSFSHSVTLPHQQYFLQRLFDNKTHVTRHIAQHSVGRWVWTVHVPSSKLLTHNWFTSVNAILFANKLMSVNKVHIGLYGC